VEAACLMNGVRRADQFGAPTCGSYPGLGLVLRISHGFSPVPQQL